MITFLIGFLTGLFVNFFVPGASAEDSHPVPTGNYVIATKGLDGEVCLKDFVSIDGSKIQFKDGKTVDITSRKLIFVGKDDGGNTLEIFEFESEGELYQMYVTALYVELNGERFGRFVSDKNIFQYVEKN